MCVVSIDGALYAAGGAVGGGDSAGDAADGGDAAIGVIFIAGLAVVGVGDPGEAVLVVIGEIEQRGGFAEVVDAFEAIQQVVAKFLFCPHRYRARRGDARQLVGGIVFVRVSRGGRSIEQDGFDKLVDVVIVILNAAVVRIGLGDNALRQVIVIAGAGLQRLRLK